MTKVFCDACGSDISDFHSRSRLEIGRGVVENITRYDLCIKCATRIKNKILSFIAEIAKEENASNEKAGN